MTKRSIALFVALAAAACSRTPTPEAGELRITPLGGDVRLVDGGETSVLEEATTVDAGVSLLTGLDGWAQVELPSGNSVELAPGGEIRVDGEEPLIAKGSALVRSDSDITVRAGLSGEAEITATNSIFRVDSDISVKLAVYRGAATVLGSGVGAVPALRQATIVQGSDIYRSPGPLQVRPNNRWDAELLGDAIDLGLRLVGLEKGLTRQLPQNDAVEAVSAALERHFPPSAIRSAIEQLGDAARAVVAAVVAQQVERIGGGSRARILAEVVDLQTLGANWIVVVAEWGLAQAAAEVLAQLGELATAIAESVAPPAPPPGQDTGITPVGPDESGPNGGNTGEPDPRDNPSNKNEPPAEPPEEPGDGGEPPPPTCGNAVECTVDDILTNPKIDGVV